MPRSTRKKSKTGTCHVMLRVNTEPSTVHWGTQFNLFSVNMKKPDDLELKKNESYGIRHVGLLAGLRYYF